MKLSPSLIVDLAVNLLGPWLAYRLALPHWGETNATIASAVPPLVWSAIELVRFRRVDAVSALVLIGIALSVLAMALGGGPRMLLLRESLASGAVGVAFLASFVLKKPLMYYLARATLAREDSARAARLETLWHTQPAFVAAMRAMTFIWGAGLTAEMVARAVIVWHWPVERSIAVLPFVGYGVYGALVLCTLGYGRLMKRRFAAEQTA